MSLYTVPWRKRKKLNKSFYSFRTPMGRWHCSEVCNKLNQLWGKISIFWPTSRTEGRFPTSSTYLFSPSWKYIYHSQPTEKKLLLFENPEVWQPKIFLLNFNFTFFHSVYTVYQNISVFTLLVWKKTRVISVVSLKDHFPPLLPGSELNPLPVWRRSTELLTLYRSRELVQYVLGSHRHHWDCRVPVSGSAAWKAKKVINSSKSNAHLLPSHHLLNTARAHLEPWKQRGCYTALQQFALLFTASSRGTFIETRCTNESKRSQIVTKATNKGTVRSFLATAAQYPAKDYYILYNIIYILLQSKIEKCSLVWKSTFQKIVSVLQWHRTATPHQYVTSSHTQTSHKALALH